MEHARGRSRPRAQPGSSLRGRTEPESVRPCACGQCSMPYGTLTNIHAASHVKIWSCRALFLVSPDQVRQGRSKARLGRGVFQPQTRPRVCGFKTLRNKTCGRKNAPVRGPVSKPGLGLARFMETGGSAGFPMGSPPGTRPASPDGPWEHTQQTNPAIRGDRGRLGAIECAEKWHVREGRSPPA